MVLFQNYREGGSSFIQLRPQPQSYALLTGERDKKAPLSHHLSGNELFDIDAEQFLAFLRFEQREKSDQLGIEIDSFD